MRALTRKQLQVILFLLILTLGIFVRVWEFGPTPPGLAKDEAAIGVDAYSILHYGMDRNGISLPVHLISRGSGQNALYGYILIPFIALFGLSLTIVRLPMLISGILSLPLTYLLGTEIEDSELGLITMFFMAVSPWHIILSRWGLESNILPFVFLIGFVLLIKSINNNKLYPIACLFFSLCLYAYGTAYAFIPIFLISASSLLIYKKQLSIKQLLLGILIFLIFAIPIIAFIVINKWKMESLHLFAFTVPRLPGLSRFESVSYLFQPNAISLIFHNLINLFTLLITQSDHHVINVVEPYGYFYTLTFPLFVLGVWQLVKRPGRNIPSTILIIIFWIAAAILLGMMQPVNINRMNIIFIPIIFCVAVFIYRISQKSQVIIPSTIVITMCLLSLFIRDYHGPRYLNRNRNNFFVGLMPAIQYATTISKDEICISDQDHGVLPAPELYVLFTEHMNPSIYLPSVHYVDPHAEFRQMLSLGRYSFGIDKCKRETRTIYIFNYQDNIPLDSELYNIRQFDDYLVYDPKGY